MMPAQPRNRLLALSVLGMVVLGGAAAGIALRPEARGSDGPPAVAPAAREAVRQAASLSDAFIAIAATVTPAVVRIEVERTASADMRPLSARLEDLFGGAAPGLPPEPVPQLGGGTGFIVSPDGHILTNYHVIADAHKVRVTLRDKHTLDAVVVGVDPTTDVAVIRIQARDLPWLELGNSDAARVGEWVLAVGNPGFEDANTLDFTVTGGIISAKGRPLNILRTELASVDPDAALYAIEDFIQTDAVINPGNSGGPLVDLRGTVVGINTAIASTTGYSQGYGFAVPSNLAQRVMSDLIAYGYVRRPLLGINIVDITQEDAEVYGLERIAGVLVEDFGPDSPAQRTGLERHDVITAVDGTPVERVGHLQRLIAQRRPGDVVTLSAVRYGRSMDFRVRLAEAPGAARTAAAAPAAATGAGIGLDVEELTPLLARQLGFPRHGGALITRVVPAGPADRRNVIATHRISSINRTPITSAAQAQALLRGARPGQVISLLCEYPDGRTYIANIRVP
jgi:serine protease Do